MFKLVKKKDRFTTFLLGFPPFYLSMFDARILLSDSIREAQPIGLRHLNYYASIFLLTVNGKPVSFQ